MDRDIPLEDRVWHALERTCRLHAPRGHCPACDERWAAVMLALSPERDRILRHDAIVETVVRDRITESKRAERYRLAWLSAKQGRARWRELYLVLLSKSLPMASAPNDDCTCGRIAVGMWVTNSRNWNPKCPDHGLESFWYNSDEQMYIRALRFDHQKTLQQCAQIIREKSELRAKLTELEQIRTTLQDDHVTAWARVRELEEEVAQLTRHDRNRRGYVRELESELADLRLAFSEMDGAHARETDSGGS